MAPTTEFRLLVAQLEATAKSVGDTCLKLRCRAAIAALRGDVRACEQHLAAAGIPAEEWEQAKGGQLDY